jgi:diguanylate cyclase (GGDEF)-like protein
VSRPRNDLDPHVPATDADIHVVTSFSGAAPADGADSGVFSYPVPANEAGRVSSLRLLKLLGTEDDAWWPTVTRLAASICGTPFAVVNLIETTYQYSLAPFGYVAQTVDRAESMCATAIMSPLPSYTADASIDARWAGNPFVTGDIDRVRAYLSAPLTLPNGHTVGTICAFSHAVTEMTPEQIDAVNDLAKLTVAMLEIRERSMQFSLAATRDPLTELPNRALMNESLAQALSRHARHDANVGVIYIDLDGFKPVNDVYGHGVGDELLRAVAARLLRTVRSSDLIARVGGDEFVIVCSSVPDPTVEWTIERVAQDIQMAFAVPFILSVGPIRISASLGVAYAAIPTDSADALIARADEAMYEDKAKKIR